MTVKKPRAKASRKSTHTPPDVDGVTFKSPFFDVVNRRPPKYFFHNGKMVLQRSIEIPSPGVSVTEPNQVQSLKDILVKRARGIQPTFFNGAYSEYATEDIQKMDFIELRDYRDRVAAHAEQLKSEYKALTNQMEQVRTKAMEDRLDALIKAQADKIPPTSNPNP